MVHSHKQLIDMLIHSFADNKRIRGLIRESNRSHLKALFNYVYEQIKATGYFFFSDNMSTVVLYYKDSSKKMNLRSSLAIFRLILCSSWCRILTNYKINKIINATRAAHAKANSYRDFIYI